MYFKYLKQSIVWYILKYQILLSFVYVKMFLNCNLCYLFFFNGKMYFILESNGTFWQD